MPRKKSKKPSRRTLLAKWSKGVRACDGNKCAVCGATKFIQAHHILPKEYYGQFQYEPMNGVSLCAGHHKWSRLSAHRNALWFSSWLAKERPAQFAWAMQRIEGKAS